MRVARISNQFRASFSSLGGVRSRRDTSLNVGGSLGIFNFVEESPRKSEWTTVKPKLIQSGLEKTCPFMFSAASEYIDFWLTSDGFAMHG